MLNKIRKIKEKRLGKWGLILCDILDVMEKNVTSDVDFYTHDGLIVLKHFKNQNVIHFNTLVFNYDSINTLVLIYESYDILRKIIIQRFPNSHVYITSEQKPKGYVVLGDKIVEYDYIRKIKI